MSTAQARIKAAVGSSIPIVFDLQRVVHESPNPDAVIEAFEENDGEFCVERIVQAVVDVCVVPGGRRALESRLKRIEIINVDEPQWNERLPNLRPVMVDDTLQVRAIFERGEEGCPTRTKIKTELMVLLELYEIPGKPRDLGGQVQKDIVPLWEEKIADAVGSHLPIEMAWDSFRGDTYTPALRTFLRDEGETVFRPLYAAIRQVLESGLVTPSVFAANIGKIRIKNLPEEEEGDMLVAVQPFKVLQKGKDELKSPEVMLKRVSAPIRSEYKEPSGKAAKGKGKHDHDDDHHDHHDHDSESHHSHGHKGKKAKHNKHNKHGGHDDHDDDHDDHDHEDEDEDEDEDEEEEEGGHHHKGKHGGKHGGDKHGGKHGGKHKHGHGESSASHSGSYKIPNAGRSNVTVVKAEKNKGKHKRSHHDDEHEDDGGFSLDGGMSDEYQDDGGHGHGKAAKSKGGHDKGKGHDKAHKTSSKGKEKHGGHHDDDEEEHDHDHDDHDAHGKHGKHGKHGGGKHGGKKHHGEDDESSHGGGKSKGKGGKKKATPALKHLTTATQFMLVIKGAYDMEAEGCHTTSEIKEALVKHFMTQEQHDAESGDEDELRHRIIPDADDELADIMGRSIPFEMDWDSLRSGGHFDECCATLVADDGGHLFGRAIEVFRALSAVPPLRDGDIERIFVSRERKNRVHFDEGDRTLHICGPFEVGPEKGTPSISDYKNELIRAFIVEEVNRTMLPKLQDSLTKHAKDKNIKVTIDWPTFHAAKDYAQAINTLVSGHGKHVFGAITEAFQLASAEELREASCKTVTIKHTPGSKADSRYCEFLDHRLTVAGAHEVGAKGCCTAKEVHAALTGKAGGRDPKSELEKRLRRTEAAVLEASSVRVTLAADYDSFAKHAKQAKDGSAGASPCIEAITEDDGKHHLSKVIKAFKMGAETLPASMRGRSSGKESAAASARTAGSAKSAGGRSEASAATGGGGGGGGSPLGCEVMLVDGDKTLVSFSGDQNGVGSERSRKPGRLLLISPFHLGGKKSEFKQDDLAAIVDCASLALLPAHHELDRLRSDHITFALQVLEGVAKRSADSDRVGHLRAVLSAPIFWQVRTKTGLAVSDLLGQCNAHALKVAGGTNQVVIKSWLVNKVSSNNVDRQRVLVLTDHNLVSVKIEEGGKIDPTKTVTVKLTTLRQVQVGALFKPGCWDLDKSGSALHQTAVRFHGPSSKGAGKPSAEKKMTYRAIMGPTELSGSPTSYINNHITANEIAWAVYTAAKVQGGSCDPPISQALPPNSGMGFGKAGKNKKPIVFN